MNDFVEAARELRASGELYQEHYFTIYDYIEAVECKNKWDKFYKGTSLAHQMFMSDNLDEKLFEGFYGTKKFELVYLIQFYDLFENVKLPLFKQGIIFQFKGKVIFLFECENGIKVYQYSK